MKMELCGSWSINAHGSCHYLRNTEQSILKVLKGQMLVFFCLNNHVAKRLTVLAAYVDMDTGSELCTITLSFLSV